MEDIYKKLRLKLKVYKRYIDDVFLIWEGSQAKLKEFLYEINIKKYDNSFTSIYSKDKVHYLDLEICSREGRIYTRIHFKDTNWNSYIPISSGHHPKWLAGITKGPMRIKR